MKKSPPFYDTTSYFDALLSQNTFSVATKQEEKQEKSWNEAKSIVTLHRQKEQSTSR